MKIFQSNFLETLPSISFVMYFVFNFVDRGLSNIFLLITLLMCIINYKVLFNVIKANKELVYSIVIFSIYISLIGFYHDTPISELDNYYRFLLLLPLLAISSNERYVTVILSTCATIGLIHALVTDAFFDDSFRLQGTSNTAITYAHMCATLCMVCLYYIFYRENGSFFLIISAFIFLSLAVATETRGPIIGIVIVTIYLGFLMSQKVHSRFNFKIPLILLSIFIVSLLTIPNNLGDRMKELSMINLSEPLKISNYDGESIYLRKRVYYAVFWVKEIQSNYALGIGPHNVEPKMAESIKEHNIKKVQAVDHLHSEYIDITLKFGLLSVILLFYIYYLLIKTEDRNHAVLLNILMIMLVSSQITQSQFAHHQAITFFITLFYLLRPKRLKVG